MDMASNRSHDHSQGITVASAKDYRTEQLIHKFKLHNKDQMLGTTRDGGVSICGNE